MVSPHFEPQVGVELLSLHQAVEHGDAPFAVHADTVVVVQPQVLGDGVEDEWARHEGELVLRLHLEEGVVLVHLQNVVERLVDELLEGDERPAAVGDARAQLCLQRVHARALLVAPLLAQQLLQRQLARLRQRLLVLLQPQQ